MHTKQYKTVARSCADRIILIGFRAARTTCARGTSLYEREGRRGESARLSVEFYSDQVQTSRGILYSLISLFSFLQITLFFQGLEWQVHRQSRDPALHSSGALRRVRGETVGREQDWFSVMWVSRRGLDSDCPV